MFSVQNGYNQNIKTINLHTEIQTNVKKIHLKPHKITNHSTLSESSITVHYKGKMFMMRSN